MTPEEFAGYRRTLLAERESLLAEIGELEALIAEQEVRQEAVDQVSQLAAELRERLAELTFEEKQVMLHHLDLQVMVWADRRVRIVWAGEALRRQQQPVNHKASALQGVCSFAGFSATRRAPLFALDIPAEVLAGARAKVQRTYLAAGA